MRVPPCGYHSAAAGCRDGGMLQLMVGCVVSWAELIGVAMMIPVSLYDSCRYVCNFSYSKAHGWVHGIVFHEYVEPAGITCADCQNLKNQSIACTHVISFGLMVGSTNLNWPDAMENERILGCVEQEFTCHEVLSLSLRGSSLTGGSAGAVPSSPPWVESGRRSTVAMGLVCFRRRCRRSRVSSPTRLPLL